MHRIFDPRRILADDPSKLKGNCAEFLGLFSLLRHWVNVDAPSEPELVQPKASFNKLCDVIQLILHIKRGIVASDVGVAELAAASSEFLHLHQVTDTPWTL